ncbi:hypothetical protein HMPREF3218_0201282 [Prevotella bivia]|nr:hypothetical protein HMPREF3218_0201282 [Prevotella bivia]
MSAAKIRVYREKKEFPLSYFHRVVFCMAFCFSTVCSHGKVQPQKVYFLF